MIIVVQNKNSIVNFDNILQVYRKECSIRCEDCNNSYGDLGVYKTEERAKKVFQDIIGFYIRTKEKNKVYRMPKE